MVVKFYNTLSGEKEVFVPLNDKFVGMYSCGPTVYDFAHIGNFRAYVFADLLRRYLEFRGYRVRQIMNITDLDDKTIRASGEQGVSLREYTDRYIKFFFEDIDLLRIRRADLYPRVTDHIEEMADMVRVLLDKGYAYRKNGSIYFKVEQFRDYGRLARLDLSKIKPGATVEADEYEKEDVRDFALWKEKKEGEPFWVASIGEGRPGWHIECSAISTEYFGPTIDIHTGGVDNIFPHNQNELAQSEAATGQKFVKYWMHCEHLLVNGKKMSKSLGNIIALRDLINKGYRPEALRYLFVSSHYRSKLNFTWESIQHAANTLDRLNKFVERVRDYESNVRKNDEITMLISRTEEKFVDEMDNDLNTPGAFAAIFELVGKVNPALDEGNLSTEDAKMVYELMLRFDDVLGILTPGEREELSREIEALIEERERARKMKNFALADEIRNRLGEMGIILEDTREGVRWRRK
ncbi:cysteinyl-tRNA synthetase [Candidatus Methanoperedens nitroreducens]|uniref:Cysteine--tRNA ligase n=1 Tax=Candidatus Methanoperedens nitratireducens TaxID=1392998 RepID=A0A062VA62_9EURY|nr:cysteine--tRNA ligase [Candidatus Methanoperedens nitroreducens]KCZ72614.1 cysteinyl-tRNA synthetase [Candidatus Methanoperedens nitroreducens]MDJ1423454.1 cysteine--tRNA ligase [Candidatus Methanoperedens sp.]